MTYPATTADLRIAGCGNLFIKGTLIFVPEIAALDTVIDDIPGKTRRLVMAADSELLGRQAPSLHGLFPGYGLPGHRQEDIGQPAISSRQNRLEKHLFGLVMHKMDIGLTVEPVAEHSQPAFEFADDMTGRTDLTRRQTFTNAKGMKLKGSPGFRGKTVDRDAYFAQSASGPPDRLYAFSHFSYEGYGLLKIEIGFGRQANHQIELQFIQTCLDQSLSSLKKILFAEIFIDDPAQPLGTAIGRNGNAFEMTLTQEIEKGRIDSIRPQG
jgi:hypothetical protein